MGNDAAINDALVSHGHTVTLCGFSAIDRYLGWDSLPFMLIETDAGLPDLARHFEGLRFPGAGLADAAVDQGGRSYLFRCIDSEDDLHDSLRAARRPSYKFLGFNQDGKTRRFRDPWGFYPLLRQLRDGAVTLPYGVALPHTPAPVKNPETGSGHAFIRGLSLEMPPPWWEGLNPAAGRYRVIMDASLILARYGTADDTPSIAKIAKILEHLTLQGSDLRNTAVQGHTSDLPPQAESQRLLLSSLLVSPRPDLGMELLKAAGFVAEFWPELAQLDDVDHSKEFHPEGNVWKHTLETFRYRKTPDLVLSLGLLLHDVGKPLAAAAGTRRFDGHAEIGARAARKFLERLGFERPLIENIHYLVKNHMLPAALPRLPLTRTEETLESPLFPTLLELYRCDESSSFKGLDGYYESSAAYQAYLRHLRNPYRSADGKKLASHKKSGFES
jgi:poly(A) polymerase